jgi:hypothetical protein
MAKQSPGFMRGTWSADREGGRGIGFQVFETREHAEAVAAMLRSPDGPPVPEGVSIETTTVYELMGEA